MNKNVPGEMINDPVWQLPFQTVALPWLWWCQSKTQKASGVTNETDCGGKKPLPELSGSSHSGGHSRCTTMHDACEKSFFFSLTLKNKQKDNNYGRDATVSPPCEFTGGWWNAGGDWRCAGWEKTAISHIAGGAAEDFSNKRRRGGHCEDRQCFSKMRCSERLPFWSSPFLPHDWWRWCTRNQTESVFSLNIHCVWIFGFFFFFLINLKESVQFVPLPDCV